MSTAAPTGALVRFYAGESARIARAFELTGNGRSAVRERAELVGNIEGALSLLDSRFLAGDAAMFRQLHDELLPRLVRREWQSLVQGIAELARSRHAKYGDTIFHLEPNVKECPGGLRDQHIAGW